MACHQVLWGMEHWAGVAHQGKAQKGPLGRALLGKGWLGTEQPHLVEALEENLEHLDQEQLDRLAQGGIPDW